MRERELRRRLRQMPAPESEPARLQTIAKAKAELRRREPAPVIRGGSWRLRRWLVPLGLILALAGFGLTAPGRGLAEDLAELVGIGDEPTEQPIFNPEPSAEAVVIGVGESETGIGWEAVAARYGESAGGEDVASSPAPLCFRVSFPGHDQAGTLQCLTQASSAAFAVDTVNATAFTGPSELAVSEQTVVVGVIGSAVTEVEVEMEGRQTQAQVFALSPELQERLNVEIDASFFIAFVAEPEAAGAGPRVAAFSSEGQQLSSRVVEIVDAP